jgi:30S ribosomal protein S31
LTIALAASTLAQLNQHLLYFMGKGDKKSKKGKLFMGTFGNSRKRSSANQSAAVVAETKEEAKPAAKKAKK